MNFCLVVIRSGTLSLGSMIALCLIYHKVADIRKDEADGRRTLVKDAFEEVEPKLKNPKEEND